jgi:carbon monoxide dehydrogenase subunit G
LTEPDSLVSEISFVTTTAHGAVSYVPVIWSPTAVVAKVKGQEAGTLDVSVAVTL